MEALQDPWAEGPNESGGRAAPAQKAPRDSLLEASQEGAGQLGINSPFPARAFWKMPAFSRGGPGPRPRQQQARPGRQPVFSGFPRGTAFWQDARETRRPGSCFPLLGQRRKK